MSDFMRSIEIVNAKNKELPRTNVVFNPVLYLSTKIVVQLKKKLYITIGVAVIIVIAAATYLMRPLSPTETKTFSNDGVDVTVLYSRPYKKGRLIFGSAGDGALVPFGKYWRLGANKATEFTVNKDVTFNDKPLKAGTYRMYAIPGDTSWEVVLNSELGKSGSEEPDHSKDILTTSVKSDKANSQHEQFTIDLHAGNSGIKMSFLWDTTVIIIPITVN